MDSKKISFGFNKLSKKTTIVSAKASLENKKVELIDCLEGQSIKIKDAVEEVYKPLIIPIKDNKKNLLDRIREARLRQTDLKEQPEDTRPDSELTPEELAARELIKEAKKRLENGIITDGSKVSILPLKPENLILEGEKESTLEDYESIPVADYGLAILRGMGWKDGMPIGKNVSKTALVSVPELRPKGLGLGATKIIQSEKPKQNATDKAGNELTLVKGSYAKIIAGGEKGNYCVIQGFDEDAGRVIVNVHPKGNILNINEFMLIPVEKDEFSRGSKVLNNVKYEEYKEKSDKKLQKHRENSDMKMESSSSREDKHYSIKNRKKHSSDDESEREILSKRNTKIKHEEESYSRSRSHSKNKDNKYRHSESSDSEHYRKEKKSHKKSKSKSRNRSRSKDKKHKKQKSKSRRDSNLSDSDSDYSKKHKYRNRHKSSSEEDSKRSHRRK